MKRIKSDALLEYDKVVDLYQLCCSLYRFCDSIRVKANVLYGVLKPYLIEDPIELRDYVSDQDNK